MKVIRVLELLGSNKVTATNLATDSNTEWNTGSITAGDIRKVTTTANGASEASYRVYEALTSHTTKDPTVEMDPDNALYVSPGVGTNWKEIGSVAEWAWASNVYQDQSTRNANFYVTVTPAQRIDAIFLGNLVAKEFNVTITSATYGTLHNVDYDVSLPRGLGSWLRWFTEPFANLKDYAIYNLPTAVDAVITITIDNGSSDASAGAILMGQALTVGTAIQGAGFGLDDYSRATFLPSSGRTLITAKNYSRVADIDVLIDKPKFQTLQQEITGLRNVVSVWTGVESDGGTSIMGILERYRTVLEGPEKAIMNLRIKGVT